MYIMRLYYIFPFALFNKLWKYYFIIKQSVEILITLTLYFQNI
jgi:hypothetical protein